MILRAHDTQAWLEDNRCGGVRADGTQTIAGARVHLCSFVDQHTPPLIMRQPMAVGTRTLISSRDGVAVDAASQLHSKTYLDLLVGHPLGLQHYWVFDKAACEHHHLLHGDAGLCSGLCLDKPGPVALHKEDRRLTAAADHLQRGGWLAGVAGWTWHRPDALVSARSNVCWCLDRLEKYDQQGRPLRASSYHGPCFRQQPANQKGAWSYMLCSKMA